MKRNTDEIVCPHCDHEFQNSWQYGVGEDEGLGEFACGECGRAFYARRNIVVSYSSETLASRRGLS